MILPIYLFICGGAFDGLEKIIESRMDTSSIGFNSDVKSKTELNVGEALKHALPQDFVKFGLIPEFIGRVPVTVSLRHSIGMRLSDILRSLRTHLSSSTRSCLSLTV